MNASSERLLSINYGPGGPLSIGQKCSNTVLLNGSIFLPHTSGGPASGTSTKRNSSSLAVDQSEQEYRRSSGTVVRFATIDSQSDNEQDDLSTTENSLTIGNGILKNGSQQIRMQTIVKDGDEKEDQERTEEKDEETSLSDATTTDNSLSLQSYPMDNATAIMLDVGERMEGDVFM
jgi:hypothetical protein